MLFFTLSVNGDKNLGTSRTEKKCCESVTKVNEIGKLVANNDLNLNLFVLGNVYTRHIFIWLTLHF